MSSHVERILTVLQFKRIAMSLEWKGFISLAGILLLPLIVFTALSV